MGLSVWVELVGNLWKKKMGKIINYGHFRGLDFLSWPVLVFWP